MTAPHFDVCVATLGLRSLSPLLMSLGEQGVSHRLHVEVDRIGHAPAAWNRAVRRGRAPWVAIMPDDALLMPGYLAAVAAVVGTRPVRRIEDFDAESPDDARAEQWRPAAVRARLAGNVPEQRGSSDLGLCVRRDVFEAVGGYDEGYEAAALFDSDLLFALWTYAAAHPDEPVVENDRAVVYHPAPLNAAGWGRPDVSKSDDEKRAVIARAAARCRAKYPELYHRHLANVLHYGVRGVD